MADNLFSELLGDENDNEQYIQFNGESKHIILATVDKNKLVYMADGKKEDLMYMIESLDKIMQSRLIEIDVEEGTDIELMRRNAIAFNDKYGYVLNG